MRTPTRTVRYLRRAAGLSRPSRSKSKRRKWPRPTTSSTVSGEQISHRKPPGIVGKPIDIGRLEQPMLITHANRSELPPEVRKYAILQPRITIVARAFIWSVEIAVPVDPARDRPADRGTVAAPALIADHFDLLDRQVGMRRGHPAAPRTSHLQASSKDRQLLQPTSTLSWPSDPPDSNPQRSIVLMISYPRDKATTAVPWPFDPHQTAVAINLPHRPPTRRGDRPGIRLAGPGPRASCLVLGRRASAQGHC